MNLNNEVQKFLSSCSDSVEFDEVLKFAEHITNHIKANNENLKERNRILRCRPDLPVDRLPYIKRLDELEEENKALKARIDDGVRVTASKMPNNSFEICAQSHGIYEKNAVLILDDGVDL